MFVGWRKIECKIKMLQCKSGEKRERGRRRRFENNASDRLEQDDSRF